LLQEFYETTLDALKDAKNERLWFKTNCKVSIFLVVMIKIHLALKVLISEENLEHKH